MHILRYAYLYQLASKQTIWNVTKPEFLGRMSCIIHLSVLVLHIDIILSTINVNLLLYPKTMLLVWGVTVHHSYCCVFNLLLQKEIALYTASKFNTEFSWFDLDGDIDPLFKVIFNSHIILPRPWLSHQSSDCSVTVLCRHRLESVSGFLLYFCLSMLCNQAELCFATYWPFFIE